MSIIKKCSDKSEWDEYVLDKGGHPLQLWGWGESKSKHGWSAERLLMIDDSEKAIGTAQVLIRRLPWPFKSLAYIPRGPVVGKGDSDEFLQLLARYIRDNHHCVSLSIEPDLKEFTGPKGWKKSKNHILSAETVILDLNKSEDELLADMAKKTRQYIRKSGNSGIVIKSVKSDKDLQECLDIYRQTSERAGFGIHSEQYYLDIYTSMGEHSPVLVAYLKNQPVAFLWMAVSADVAYELYGGMNDVGKEMRANYALKWAMISKCKEWGLSRYDFGGMIDGGVSNFKMGWTKEEAVLVGTFDYPISRLYGVYSVVLPFGKKLVRRLKALLGH